MQIIRINKAQATQDGAGVNITRIAGFDGKSLDPFLMIDELKSDNSSDYMAGFPPHPHRGIETFTYIRKGGFEHQDQMGNKKAIRAGDVQWMSTGRGVIHSEMPLSDAEQGMHGFQIWLNMPAKDKMRAPRYQDTTEHKAPVIATHSGAELKALAGEWQVEGQTASSPINDLAGNGAIADVVLPPQQQITLDMSGFGKVLVYIHTGSLADTRLSATYQLELDPSYPVELRSGEQGAGMLVLAGQPIGEKIAHMGPFVMNTQEELHQAVRDYHAGKFGSI
ncbi:pirin family protein [Pseudoalteromonas rubra]|uniref:Pirin family protein n=1 Tax=Pseudoalteromonas rubra TaxID=43658 RepID=A0A5S3WRE6_9GAMM|nr:pirin family protein [Pseudoalteromonas rubra]TMP30775.1 pirin family protein [Pseudoalteromonas rubra]TMP34143.1 pirin family protein [Pseudoalteromonas rubra]